MAGATLVPAFVNHGFIAVEGTNRDIQILFAVFVSRWGPRLVEWGPQLAVWSQQS